MFFTAPGEPSAPAPCLDRTQRVPCADACFGWQLHKRNRTSAAAVQACVSSNFKDHSDAEGKVERLVSVPMFCLFLVDIVNVLIFCVEKALCSILFYRYKNTHMGKSGKRFN